MHRLDDVIAALAALPLPPPGVETVALLAAVGRVAAQPICAAHDQPSFDTAAMDGYALAIDSVRPLGPYEVIGAVLAGQACEAVLLPGQAMRVTTGAPIPPGTHGVVQLENVRRDERHIRLDEPLCYGGHVRLRGSELGEGEPLLRAGERILPLHVGLLASQGVASLTVFRRPRVGVLSTGSELIGLGEVPGRAQIVDANRPQLLALLQQQGAEAIDLGHVGDNLADTQASLQDAAARCDIILSSGGVSLGEADHVRDAIHALGALNAWQLAIKPGKPFAWGQVLGKPFFALPGNPVAAVITFLLLARAVVARAMGEADSSLPRCSYVLGESVDNPGGRRLFLRAALTHDKGRQIATPFEQQGAAALISLARADVLLDISEKTSLAAGASVAGYKLRAASLI